MGPLTASQLPFPRVALVFLWYFFPSLIIVPGLPGNIVRQAGFTQHWASVRVTKPRSDVNGAAPSEAWKGTEVLGLVEGPGLVSYITYPVPVIPCQPRHLCVRTSILPDESPL